MVFVDNTTPSNAQYQQMGRSYPGSANETTRQRANDWLTMYYTNAYNTALLNYQNEYNSPLRQMQRYQEAGLNPFLVGNDPGNMGGSYSATPPRGSSDPGITTNQIANNAIQGVNQVNNTLRTAQSLYDYVKFGRPLNELNLQNQGYINSQNFSNAIAAAANAESKEAEARWNKYWNFGESYAPDVVGSPRAKYMEESTNQKSAQVEQLKAIVDVLYPSQKAANEAKTALSLFQKEILEGQKGAILNIDTGYENLDAILKMVGFWLLNK